MADGRFVSKSIAQSEQLGRVSLEADYLFGRCIPHLDREGRMIGNPELVRSLVCPLRAELTAERIRELLGELVREELVIWYEAAGRQCLFFPGFARHQRGMRKKREAPSRFPPPGGKDAQPLLIKEAGPSPEDSRLTPAEVKGSEAKGSGSEVKTSAAPTAHQPAHNWVAPFCEAWQQRFQGIAPGGRIGKALRPLRVHHPDEKILERWTRYLAATEAQYASPERFAQTFGDWDGGAAPRIKAAPSRLDPRPGESGDDYLKRVTRG